ncbi:MAG TPA: T9SS type A sorting domain-containing protein [Saprospiraceae bacterium]|nr:T9SS type A sorting domain-containing protein [Saprospiraceae bacterium]HMQ83371.1 T9SS type A sorting domain-containing protein [Saprospiraceae bacterium]
MKKTNHRLNRGALVFTVILFAGVSVFGQNPATGIYRAEMDKEVLNDVRVSITIGRRNELKDFVLFDWGDGSPLDTAFRTSANYVGLYENEYYYLEKYFASHWYEDTGLYRIGFRDSFLVDDIVNIEESGTKVLELYDTIVLYPPVNALAVNTSPDIFTTPGLLYLEGDVVTHSVNIASDELFIGDIYYGELIPFPAENYSLPLASDSIYMVQSQSGGGGTMIWDKPLMTGRYALAINIRESRPFTINGVLDTFLLSTTLRTMTVLITDEFLVSTVGVDEFPGLVSVYPNPATSMLQIDCALPDQGAVLTIFNSNGQLCYFMEIGNSGNVQHFSIPVSDWPPGLYVLRMQVGDAVWSRKVVVER